MDELKAAANAGRLEAALLALAFAMHYWVWRVENPPPVDDDERISQAFKIQYAKVHGDGLIRD